MENMVRNEEPTVAAEPGPNRSYGAFELPAFQREPRWVVSTAAVGPYTANYPFTNGRHIPEAA